MELAVYHIIQQQVFDICIKRKDRYALLQNRFSRLFNNELFPMLETFIDREIPANFNVRIETMTVDLGTVRYEYLEQDITRIFIESFRKALHAITGDISVSNALPAAAEVTNDRADRHLEIIEFFLFTGMLPWWAATENYTDHLAITDELLLHKKYEFRELLYRTGDNETVRKRLAWQFPETYIRSVIKILEPDKAGFIFQYHTEVTALQEDQQFVKSEAKEFEKAIWLFVLDYLLVERGSIFEERSFVKLSLYKMSMFFNVQYEELLIAFYKAVQMVPPSLKRSGGLGLIIEYVYNEHFFQQQEPDEDGTYTVKERADEEMSLLQQVRTVKYYLAHGSFPGESAFTTRESVIRWLRELIEKLPSLFITILTELVYRQPVRQKRLYQLMDMPLLKKVSMVMAAQHETIIAGYFGLLRLVFEGGTNVVATIADKTFIYQSAFEGILLVKQESVSIPVFVRRHLLAISTYYSIDHKKLAKALLQIIVQQHGKSKHPAELVAGITALLTADEKKGVKEFSAADEGNGIEVSKTGLSIINTGVELSHHAIEIIKQLMAQYSQTEGKEVTARDLLMKLLIDREVPDSIKGISGNEWDQLLKALLLTAYRKDSTEVKELLRLLPVQSAGFITLYQLFSNAATIEERSLFSLIRTATEIKLVEWWQAHSDIQDSATKRLPEIIEAVMVNGKGEWFMRLLQTEAFRNWLLPVSLSYIPEQAIDRVVELIQPGLAKELPGKPLAGEQNNKSSDALLLLQIKNELTKKKREEERRLHAENYPVLKEPEVEKIYVPNAGLVLLYPFYSTYFGRLGLLEKGKFKDAQAHERAVHLLSFIADGKEEHAEHTLPLNKILCGFPLKEPVDHTFSIQENERELSIQMLHVIFQRWEKLKNSSVEGFRDSFLKRQGILTLTGDGWNLRVEQRGYDMLLDTMPWGFRFIKSSWMDTILTVEWI